MKKFSMKFAGFIAIYSVSLCGIINFRQMVLNTINSDANTPSVFASFLIPVYSFVSATIMGFFPDIHLVLAMCGQSQITSFIVEGFKFIDMIYLQFFRCIHNHPMHQKSTTFSFKVTGTEGIKSSIPLAYCTPFVF